LNVRAAVAGRVTQGEDAPGPAAPALQGDEEVAVGCNREVPRRADLVRDDEGAETGGEREATVVGIANG
jgi:hypothetical protein